MRTNIEIDDRLLKEAMKIAGVKTKRAAVDSALRQMLQLERQAGIRKLRGQVEFWDEVPDRRAAPLSNRKPKAA